MDYFCPQKSFDVCDSTASCHMIAMTAACFDLFFCAPLTEEKLCVLGDLPLDNDLPFTYSHIP